MVRKVVMLGSLEKEKAAARVIIMIVCQRVWTETRRMRK